MKNEEASPHVLDEKEQAVLEIGGVLHQVTIMGFNNGEIEKLRELMLEVKSGRIDPKKAKEEAYIIMSQKADYH